MYKVLHYWDLDCMMGPQFENYIEVLAHILNHDGSYDKKTRVYEDGHGIDLETYVGNDGSSLYLARYKGTWVHEHIFLRWNSWERRQAERLRKAGYKYRNGPVPFTGHHRGWGSPGVRYPHVFAEIRECTNPEFKEFHRQRRLKAMCEYRWWDDMPLKSTHPRSWKEKKLEHQWQKHLH